VRERGRCSARPICGLRDACEQLAAGVQRAAQQEIERLEAAVLGNGSPRRRFAFCRRCVRRASARADYRTGDWGHRPLRQCWGLRVLVSLREPVVECPPVVAGLSFVKPKPGGSLASIAGPVSPAYEAYCGAVCPGGSAPRSAQARSGASGRGCS